MTVTRPRPSFVAARRREMTPLLSAIETLKTHDHLCLLYATKTEQFSAVVPYLRLGLERNERCIYLIDENSAGEVLKALKDDGVDTDAAVASGALAVIGKRDSYLKRGRFDPGRMIRFFEEASKQAEAEGYDALRVTGEMIWVLGAETGAERLIEYEVKLNEVLPRLDLSMLGQYSRVRFGPAVIKEVIHTHPYVISGGAVARNRFFIPVKEYLSPAKPAVEVERLLENILAFQTSEQLLKSSGARYRELLESVIDWVWEVDEKGVYTYAGPQVRGMLGYAPEEVLGKTPFDLMPADEAARVAEIFKAAVAARKPLIALDNRNLHKDGHVVVLETNGVPAFDPSGRLIGYHGIDRDVTVRKRMEEALRLSEKNLNRAQAVAHIGSWFLDIAKNELLWSEETYRIFQVPFGTPMTYEKFLDKVHPDDRTTVSAAWAAALEHKPYDIEHRTLVDGKVKWVRERAEVEFGPDGRALKGVGTVQDITARKQTEKEREQFFRFFQASADLMCMADPNGAFTKTNPAFTRALGYSQAELVSKPFIEFVVPQDKQATLDEMARQQKLGATLNFENRYLCKDGSVKRLEWRAVYIKEEGTTYAVARDVTELKQAQDDIQRLNADLEERVRVRTAQVEAANKELEAFTYSVSHDLRAPLRAMDGFSQILMEEYAPKLEPECVRYLGLIRKGAQTMGRLIDDLLAFSRLGRQAISKSFVAMDEVVRGAIESLKDQAQGRRVIFKVGALAPCEGDFALLTQVWVNLISNALKYTRERPEAVIEIDSRDEEGETVYRIKDNGVGFDMRFVDKLFKVFQRLHSKEEYEGTGVGLAIVARVVERHGGRVWARGEPGRGAELCFTLDGRKP